MRVRTVVRHALLVAIGIGLVFLSSIAVLLLQTRSLNHSTRADSKTYLYYSCDPAVVFNDGQSRVTLEVATTGQGINRVRIRGTTPLPMYDDKTHGDRVAGDGIYTLKDYVVPGPFLLPFGNTQNTWNPGVDIEKNDGTTEYASVGIGLVNPDLVFPLTQMAPNLYASEYAFFIVDPGGSTMDAVIPLGDIKCGDTAFGAFQKLYSVFPDVFDFVVVMSGGAVFDPARNYAENVPYFVPAKNTVQRTGISVFDDTAKFSSQGRLRGMIYHSWGLGAILDHEIGHAFSASLGKTLDLSYCQQCSGNHWNPLTDIRGQMSAFLFHNDVQFGAGHLFDNGDGTWRIERENDNTAGYSKLDLYAMGLIPPEEVPPIHKLVNPNLTDAKHVTAERVDTYTIQQIMQAEGGPRVPSSQQSPKDFTLAFVAIKNKAFTSAEYSFYSLIARYFASRGAGEMSMNTFYQATGGRGSLDAILPVGRAHFAQFANGGGFASTVVLANPSSTQTANGEAKFSGQSAEGLAVSINGSAAASTAPFSIPPLGAARLASDGHGNLGAGSARVVSNIPLGGVVCFSFPGFGIAGVGESAPLNQFVIPVVRSAQGLNTGIALVSLEDYDTEVDLSLRRLDGVEASGGAASRTLGPGAHLAQFINELFPAANTSNFEGSVRVSVKTQGATLAGTAIQQGSLPGEFTTLPVIPVNPATTAKTLYFAQFGHAPGLTSSFFLTNPGGSPASGQLTFNADAGTPLSVSINGQPATTTVNFTLPPYGSAVLTTSGGGSAVGSARVVTDNPIGGVLRFAIAGLGIAGVGASSPSSSLIVPVARSVSRNVQTGIAVTAVGTSAHLTLTLRNRNGQPVSGGTRTLDPAANGHVAKYVAELFPDANTNEFEGTVTISSAGGQIAATAIELGSAPGEFTTFPVTALR